MSSQSDLLSYKSRLHGAGIFEDIGEGGKRAHRDGKAFDVGLEGVLEGDAHEEVERSRVEGSKGAHSLGLEGIDVPLRFNRDGGAPRGARTKSTSCPCLSRQCWMGVEPWRMALSSFRTRCSQKKPFSFAGISWSPWAQATKPVSNA